MSLILLNEFGSIAHSSNSNNVKCNSQSLFCFLNTVRKWMNVNAFNNRFRFLILTKTNNMMFLSKFNYSGVFCGFFCSNILCFILLSISQEVTEIILEYYVYTLIWRMYDYVKCILCSMVKFYRNLINESNVDYQIYYIWQEQMYMYINCILRLHIIVY